MAETKLIQTQTTVNTVGDLIKILTEFVASELPNTVVVFISDVVGADNGTPYNENELLVIMNNYPEEIDFTINSNGELIVIADDASLYSIDSNGDLIYTTP